MLCSSHSPGELVLLISMAFICLVGVAVGVTFLYTLYTQDDITDDEGSIVHSEVLTKQQVKAILSYIKKIKEQSNDSN